MLEDMQEAREQDIAADREYRSQQAQQLERICDGLDRSQELERKALFELLDWVKRGPPDG